MYRSFQNRTVKTTLKSLIFDEVTDENMLAPFYGPRCSWRSERTSSPRSFRARPRGTAGLI